MPAADRRKQKEKKYAGKWFTFDFNDASVSPKDFSKYSEVKETAQKLL
jgi:hypothetical protein